MASGACYVKVDLSGHVMYLKIVTHRHLKGLWCPHVMCLALALSVSEDNMLSHTGNTHTIVHTEASEYLSNRFSWLSFPLWEWGIITYYQVLYDMNNVQILPVPCIISHEIALWFLQHTLMHGKLNVFLGKEKQPQSKPTASSQMNCLII